MYSCADKGLVKFKMNSYQEGKLLYSMEIPEGYTFNKYSDDHGYKEYHYTYENGNTIFITDDAKSGSSFIKFETIDYGNLIRSKILFNDTTNVSGMFEGKLWKQVKESSIVYGYFNVDSTQKEMFDQALETLERK